MNLADIIIDSGFSGELSLMANYFSGEKEIPDPKNFMDERLVYEAIRAYQTQQLLAQITPVDPAYMMDPSILPDYAVIREFIGGSI